MTSLPPLAPQLVSERYQRQMALDDFGSQGQQNLKQAHVLLVGAGGLGSPAALYLAGAGVGTLTLADHDCVSLTNLHRQVLYGEADIGRPKAEVARRALATRNSDIDCRALSVRLEGSALAQAVAHADLVLDCTDNLTARRALNAACLTSATPWVHASVMGLCGQITCFMPPFSHGCYHCLFPDAPAPPSAPFPVLGPLPGLLGAMQALEAIRWLVHGHSPLSTTLALFDGACHRWRYLERTPDPHCPCCGASR